MYVDTVTIFTRGGDTWYPTIVHGADFNGSRAAILARYGETSKDNAELHLRLADGKVAGKPYLLPKEWEALTAANKATNLTVREGDFFAVGDFTSLAPQGTVNDTAYAAGFYDYMNRTYDDVFLITSAARYSVIPHIEILAR